MNIMVPRLCLEMRCFRTWKSSSFKLRKGGGCCQHNHRRSLLDVSTFKQLNLPLTLPETHGFTGNLIPFTGNYCWPIFHLMIFLSWFEDTNLMASALWLPSPSFKTINEQQRDHDHHHHNLHHHHHHHHYYRHPFASLASKILFQKIPDSKHHQNISTFTMHQDKS